MIDGCNQWCECLGVLGNWRSGPQTAEEKHPIARWGTNLSHSKNLSVVTQSPVAVPSGYLT